MIFLQILAVLLVVVFIGHQIYALIQDLKANKKKRPPDDKDEQK
nr:MAG TPA: protein of unknown function (DUF4083) [Inoviridae sp.]